MNTIAESVAALGYEPGDDEEIIVARLDASTGRMLHATLDACGDRRLGDCGDVYVATGAFRLGSLVNNRGRTQDNLTRIIDLAFDFDLSDYLGTDKQTILALSAEDIGIGLRSLRADAGESLSRFGCHVCVWISTGYGLLALSRLAMPDQGRISEGTRLHARLVSQIPYADQQVKDAGTRLIRLPGSFNCKNPQHLRSCYILEEIGDILHLDDFPLDDAPPKPRLYEVPRYDSELSEDDEALVIAALDEHYEEGTRHLLALGVSGMLAKAGVPQWQTERIVETFSRNDPQGLRDRLTAVSTTYTRYDTGQPVAGWTNLKTFLPERTLAKVDDLLQPYRRARERIMAVDLLLPRGDAGPLPRSVYAGPPEEAFYGWFADYRDLAMPTTESPAVFHLAVSLTYAGACIGRRVSTYNGRTLYPNLFSVIVGETGGSRKDTAIDRWRDALRASRVPGELYRAEPYTTLTGGNSGEGIIEHMAEYGANCLLRIGEFSELVMKGRIENASLRDCLQRLWDGDLDRYDLPRSTRKIKGVDNPFLSMIAASTPQTLIDVMRQSDVTSGFVNRVLWFYGQAVDRKANPPPIDPVKSAFLMGKLFERIASYADGTRIAMDDEAAAAWKPWYDNQPKREPFEALLAQRMGTNIQRIALILAVSDGSKTINAQHLAAATALVEWQYETIASEAGRWGSSDEARLGVMIRETLLRGPATGDGIHRAVGRQFWSPFLVEKILKSMLGLNSIEKEHGVYTLVEECK